MPLSVWTVAIFLPSKKVSKQAVKTAIFIPTSNERIFVTDKFFEKFGTKAL